MGWPLTGLVTILTIWMVRRANAAVEEAYPSESETAQSSLMEHSPRLAIAQRQVCLGVEN